MVRTNISDRSLIAVSGPDAETLLHNVVTCDIHKVTEAIWQPGALLTPQGKILFQFLITRVSTGSFLIEIDAASVDGFTKRMTLYRLRSQVNFVVQKESLVGIVWNCDSTLGSQYRRDVRFGANQPVFRGPALQSNASRDDYDTLRIDAGVVEPGVDYALGDTFGHDISLDQNGGLDFKKGCYVGQEVVSRMQHRGTARRRVVIVSGADLTPGATVSAAGKPAGTLGTVVGQSSLCIARLDRLKDAMDTGADIDVSGQAVSVSLPPDVSYIWPVAKEAGNG